MFGELLESRARRHRRSGGAALSIAVHIAIVGAATAATVHGTTSAHAPPMPKFIIFTPAPVPKPIERRAATSPASSSASRQPAPIDVSLSISTPIATPPTLPAIDLSHDATPAVIARGSSSDASNGLPSKTFDLTGEPSGGSEWRGREVLMHVISSAKPRYPETLRQNGIDGSVLVQFVVDTMGLVDMSSVKTMKSTHDLFTQAVRNALPSFRFKPAEVGGKRTAALAEMPFEFQVKR